MTAYLQTLNFGKIPLRSKPYSDTILVAVNVDGGIATIYKDTLTQQPYAVIEKTDDFIWNW